MTDPDWTLAECRGLTDLFYSDRPEPAIAVCETCSIRDDCLEWALDNHERFGVWGGMTPAERWPLTRGRPKPPKVIRHGDKAHIARCRAENGTPCTECRQAMQRWLYPNGPGGGKMTVAG